MTTTKHQEMWHVRCPVVGGPEDGTDDGILTPRRKTFMESIDIDGERVGWRHHQYELDELPDTDLGYGWVYRQTVTEMNGDISPVW